MTNSAPLSAIAALLAVVATGSPASEPVTPPTPPATGTISDGYSCFREQINPVGAVSNAYYCVFALEEASSYYSESARAGKLHSFISGLGGACNIGRTWEMEDPRSTHDHDLAMVVVEIRCE